MPVARTARAADFLEQIADPTRPRIDAHDIAVVVAHPDDETIGCGALLARLNGARAIVVTDGAPRDLEDARTYGFASAADYAARRNRELRAALHTAGIADHRILQLNIPDQEAVYRLVQIASDLARSFREVGICIAITHAYEGGHPDHDATALSVHRAARRCPHPVCIIEMPFYRAEGSGDVRQSFVPLAGATELVIDLTPAERELKRKMIAAHMTQKNVLAGFSVDRERFRIASDYDFSQLPNGGRVLYERENWGIDSRRWLECARSGLAEEHSAACA